MKIETLTWEKVTIKYKRPVGLEKTKQDIVECACVAYDPEHGMLSIRTSRQTGEQKYLLLARATFVSITPWEMRWTAYWWSSDPKSKMVEAEITCEF